MSSRAVPSVGRISGLVGLAKKGGPPKLHHYVDSQHRRLGPVYKDLGLGAYFLAEPRTARAVFSVEGTHPRHVVPPPWLLYNKIYSCKRGLFFMDGDEWLKYRQIMNPIFLKRKVDSSNEGSHKATFLKRKVDSSNEGSHKAVMDSFLDSCRKCKGKEIENLEQLLYKHSISFTIAHLLGTSYIEKKDLFEEDIESLSLITNAIFSSTAKLMNAPTKLVAKLGLPAWKNFVHAVDSSLVASRKLTEKILKIELSDGIMKEMLKQNLDVSTLQSLILDLILAAGDTTAFTTQWALYLLSKNPGAVQKLREDNTFARGILRETLRLYPAAIFLSRYLQEDLYTPDYIIPKGELVIISLYTMGRQESIYPEANSFKPERWLRTSTGQLSGVNEPMAYFPFALGARSCIGRKLAETQIYHTITKIFANHNLHLIEEVDMELQMVPVPTKPIRLLVMDRNNV